MPPKSINATRRAKRVIPSVTPSESGESEVFIGADASEDDDVEEDEAVGEEEQDEDEDDEDEDEDEDEVSNDDEPVGDDEVESEDPLIALDASQVSSVAPSDGELDELESTRTTPTPPDRIVPASLKIKLRVASIAEAGPSTGTQLGRGQRAAAKKGAKRTRRVTRDAELGSDDDELLEEDDDFDDSTSRRSASPSKLTARQRSKQNKNLQETLIALPDGLIKAKPIMTEAERLQKREEMARRRKRQNEQRLQDEQDQTINRLLRAQTGRSRSKLDQPSPMPDGEGSNSMIPSARGSGVSSPTKRPARVSLINGVRYVSKINDEILEVRVAVPKGREKWLDLSTRDPVSRDTSGTCAVPGCVEKRKYRCVGAFDLGGCSLDHLKQIERQASAS